MNALEELEPEPTPNELENYRRLVELQTQIVEIAAQNRAMERQCSVLREHCDQECQTPLFHGRPWRLPKIIRQLLRGRPFRLVGRWFDGLRRRPRSASPQWTESTGEPAARFPN